MPKSIAMQTLVAADSGRCSVTLQPGRVHKWVLLPGSMGNFPHQTLIHRMSVSCNELSLSNKDSVWDKLQVRLGGRPLQLRFDMVESLEVSSRVLKMPQRHKDTKEHKGVNGWNY